MPGSSVSGRLVVGNRPQSFVRLGDGFLCVIAVVGFAERIPRNLLGTINSCGWTAIQYQDVEAAARALQETLRVDALVVDSIVLSSAQAEALDVLFAIADSGALDGAPLPIVVVGSHGEGAMVQQPFAKPHVHFLRHPGTHYENLGRLVRELCHLPGTCCSR